MDQKNVKKRDVMEFDEFAKAYNTVSKAVAPKKGATVNYGGHVMKAEELWYKNDANPYKAMGIPVDDKLANVDDKVTADQVDIYPHEDTKPAAPKEQLAAAKTASKIVAGASDAALAMSESKTEDGYLCEHCGKVSKTPMVLLGEHKHYDGCRGFGE